MPGYDYEVSGGLDTYIYVIDNGINMHNTVSNYEFFFPLPYQGGKGFDRVEVIEEEILTLTD